MTYYVYYQRRNHSPSSIRVNRSTPERAIECAKHELRNEIGVTILYALPSDEVCQHCQHPLSYHGEDGCTFKIFGVMDGDAVEWPCQCKRKGKRQEVTS